MSTKAKHILTPERDDEFLDGVHYIDEPTEHLGREFNGKYNLGGGGWVYKKHGLIEDGRGWE